MIIPIYVTERTITSLEGRELFNHEVVSFDPIPVKSWQGYGGCTWFWYRGDVPRYWIKTPALATLVERPAFKPPVNKLRPDDRTGKAWAPEDFEIIAFKVVMFPGETQSGRSASVVLANARSGGAGQHPERLFEWVDGPEPVKVVKPELLIDGKPSNSIEVYASIKRLIRDNEWISNEWLVFELRPIEAARWECVPRFEFMQEPCLAPVFTVNLPSTAERFGDLIRLHPDDLGPWWTPNALVMSAQAGHQSLSLTPGSRDYRDLKPRLPVAGKPLKTQAGKVELARSQATFGWGDDQ